MFYPLQSPHLRLPRLRFDEPTGAGGGGAAPVPGDPKAAPSNNPAGEKPNYVDDNGRTWAFPADTKVEDMTDAQSKEYWREKAKKHEKNERKARRELEQKQPSTPPAAPVTPGKPDESDPAATAAAAREAGRNEGIRATLPTLIESAILARNPDIDEADLEDIIDDLDLSKFIGSDGSIDRGRIKKLADKHAAKASESGDGQQQGSGDPLARALGHNQQQPGGASPTGGGSVNSLREQVKDQIKPTKKS